MSSATSFSSILPEGLTLRTVQSDEDVEKLAAFNAAIHSFSDEPDERLADLVRDLCSERHPTTGPENYWLIEDEASGEVASTLCLIPQIWVYEGIPLRVGRMEMVGTAERFRQQGLYRILNDVFDARCRELGMDMQAITGIYYFYRLFGYEYSVVLSGGWQMPIGEVGDAPEESALSLRRARREDLRALRALYAAHCDNYAIVAGRSEAEWRYRLIDHLPGNIGGLLYYVIEQAGQVVGYAGVTRDCEPTDWMVDELVAHVPYDELVPWLLPALRQAGIEAEGEGTHTRLVLRVGPHHPVGAYLKGYPAEVRRAYAWYTRVEDPAAFLKRIAPALEARIADSALRGLTRTITLRLYTHTVALHFEDGHLQVADKARSLTGGDFSCPPNAFQMLLFGHRSYDELAHLFPDVAVRAIVKPIIDVLFPKRPAWVIPLD